MKMKLKLNRHLFQSTNMPKTTMHYPQRIIDNDTILIDGGDGTTFDTTKVRHQACKHFFNSDTIEKVGDGHILWASMLKYYHVKSVRYGLVVVSRKELTPEQTQPIAQEGC